MALLQHKWLVFMAAVVVAFLNYGIAVSMGALYVGMLNKYNVGRAKTALVQSLVITFCWGFGVVSGYLVSRFGVRVVTFCAAFMTALGFTLSYFSTTIYELYGFISVLAGIGFATMYVSAVVCVGRAFSGRQKSMALSLQSLGTGLSGFMWPNVLNTLLETYGITGTFLVLGGIFLNNLPCAIIFANCENVDIKTGNRGNQEHGKPFVDKDPNKFHQVDIGNSELDIADTRTELARSKCHFSSTMTLFSLYIIAGILNMSTLSGFLTIYQDINVFNGLTIAQSDITFMSFALSNVSSRFLPLLSVRFRNINSFVVPIVASMCGAVGQIILMTTSSLASIIIAMAITAISDGGWVASMQAIVFEILPTEKQTVGFGFVLTSFGIAATATGPIFGSLRDNTSSYLFVLIMTTTMFLISALLEVVCLVISLKLKKDNNKVIRYSNS